MPVKKSAIEQITNPAIKRISQVASINRLNASSYDDIRGILNSTLQRLMKQSILDTEYARRKTVSTSDVEYGLDDISYLHLFTMHKGKVKPCGQIKKIKRFFKYTKHRDTMNILFWFRPICNRCF